MKQWLLLLIPLLLLVSFVLLSVEVSPELIIKQASDKVSSFDRFIVESEVIVDLSAAGGVIRYASNATNVVDGNQSYSRVVTQIPFSDEFSVDETFHLIDGDYSCTNSLLRPVCIVDESGDELSIDDFNDTNYESTEYLGIKQVDGKDCKAILSTINSSKIVGVAEGITDEDLSGINGAFVYSCIDPDTGLALESLWGLSGQTTYGTMIVDLGVNISKRLISFSTDIPDNIFVLPYDLVSELEYEQLINETMAAYNLSATLSQSL